MVKRELAKSVMDVRKTSPKILCVEQVLFGKVGTIISVYGPRVVEMKDRFFDDLGNEMQSKNGNFILLGEFNGHAGSLINGYEGVNEVHRWGIRNKESERLLEFADSFDMVAGNSFCF